MPTRESDTISTKAGDTRNSDLGAHFNATWTEKYRYLDRGDFEQSRLKCSHEAVFQSVSVVIDRG